jgi:hypothetical protein
MNERIKELAIQSGLPTALDYHQKRYEKFAELIIQECINIINQPNGVGDDDVIRISNDVKEHFGVEE